jgi:malonyl-CoA O-methyltransferase
MTSDHNLFERIGESWRKAAHRVLPRLPSATKVADELRPKKDTSQLVPELAGEQMALGWIAANSIPSGGIRVHAAAAEAYPEVSGYFIPTLLNWAERNRAIQYARWLLSIQKADGSWSDPSGKTPYTFDTGQILKGLLAVSSTLPGADASIRRGCDWMLTQFAASGRIDTPDKSQWGLPGGRTVSDNIHLYTLEPLREAGERFNEPRYLDAVSRALGYYLAKPDLTDFDTLSHFHAYVLEALVDLGYPEIAARGMAEIERLQRADGSVPGYSDVDWVCSTGLAQYAVIWYKLGQREQAERAFNYVCGLQNPTGGFYGGYGPGANYFPDKEISWVVKYFLDASFWKTRATPNPARPNSQPAC